MAACARNDVRPVCPAARSDAGAHVGHVRLVQIDHQQQRFRREELEAAQPLDVVAGEFQRAQRLALFERLLAPLHQVALLLEFGRASLLQILLDAFEPPLGDAEVGEDQLVFHRLGVARRIDRPGGMGHRRIAEGADDVDERVGVLVAGDIDERLGARFRRRRHVGEFDGGGHALLRVVHRRQRIESRVGHL